MPRPTDPLAVNSILPAPFAWCLIPPGKVTLEDNPQYAGTEGGVFDVPAFSLAKYPVTNAQFQMFVAEGYANPQYWDYSASARVWRDQHQQPKAPVSDAVDNHPCGNVSWYEALAFCRWLNGYLGELQQVTLPTEQEWQRAAQGDDNRIFPWGDNFDPRKCNTLESAIGHSTPVNQYPLGASPFGVIDMSGNIWEWCLTEWGSNRVNLKGDSLRSGHGGAYKLVSDDARVGFRCGISPSSWIAHVGFRLAVAAPI